MIWPGRKSSYDPRSRSGNLEVGCDVRGWEEELRVPPLILLGLAHVSRMARLSLTHSGQDEELWHDFY